WSKVTTETVEPGRNLAAKRAWGEMGTGGSRGIRSSQDYVRKGGAAARMMLLQAAADQWKVPVGELTVANGVITHAASKRTTSHEFPLEPRHHAATRSNVRFTIPGDLGSAVEEGQTCRFAMPTACFVGEPTGL